MSWHKLALRKGMGYQECQKKHTAREFVEVMEVISRERHEHEKIDYYLAQIARFIERFRRTFIGGEDLPNEDFLLEFETKLVSVEESAQGKGSNISENGETPRPQQKEYECGPELMEDPKWRRVNENAKMVWAQRLAVVKKIEQEQGNVGPGTTT